MKKDKKVKKNSLKSKSKSKKIPKVVVVSGGFDPLHIGHVRYMQEAKKLGDKLIVVLNNDNWLKKKKGKEFMNELERKEIIEALACVDEVIISSHHENIDLNNPHDKSVCVELSQIMPHVFANGGDRFADDIPEFQLCNELGIEMVFNVGHGGKVQSSSDLVNKYTQIINNNINKHTKKKANKSTKKSKKIKKNSNRV